MECTIGNLGQEIRQPSSPYANLAQRGLLRCQVNALIAMLPENEDCARFTDSNKRLPRGAIDLGKGYVLLRAQDQLRSMRDCEAKALDIYLTAEGHHLDLWTNISASSEEVWCPAIARWARLQLPNGQIARSKWKESLKPLDKVRMARNVKVNILFYSETSQLTINFSLWRMTKFVLARSIIISDVKSVLKSPRLLCCRYILTPILFYTRSRWVQWSHVGIQGTLHSSSPTSHQYFPSSQWSHGNSLVSTVMKTGATLLKSQDWM